ncbi:RNA 2'-phosphotransferase [uncultured Robinsoniella sp.]|uniref:RNA 2'-phosphotransferase n=1 Tax=uncultured Robinsoniella sp. TaxID=904190 RepID=UPI00374F070B
MEKNKVELKEQQPPAILYHLTTNKFLDNIFKEGLKPMNNPHVHLSKKYETVDKVSREHGEPAVLQIDAGKMHHDGYKFYLDNGVWLTKEVPGKYCCTIVDLKNYKANEIKWQQIASIGKAYLDAAKKCSNPSIECMGWSHPLFMPIITNMAFACELFLKSLLKQHGKQLNNHRLLDLFNELNNDLETEIIGSDNPKDFKCNLSKISNLFVDWRYIYEQPLVAIEFNFLSTFAERLLAVIEKHSEDNV